MNSKIILSGLVIAGVLSATGYGLYQLGRQQSVEPAPTVAKDDPSQWGIAEGEAATRRHLQSGLKAGDLDPVTGQQILYYHDPMMPGKKFEAPGKSPFMDMMLVPAYATGRAADTGTVSISPRAQQNLGIRVGDVIRKEISAEVSAIGTVTWNERTEVTVQARATGFVESLHVRAALDPVAKGDPLLDLYVPEWVAVQEEYLSLRRMGGRDIQELLVAARQRMRQVGMTDRQIQRIERSGELQARLQLTAPISGVVTELLVREGSTVMPGAPLMRINDLTTVWAEAAVPESQVNLLAAGSPVSAIAPGLPGETFSGKIQTLLPELDPTTRTRRARVELANPEGSLVPGALVEMTLRAPEARSALMVPTEALIRTGMRTLVMLAEEEGSFRPVAVDTGAEMDGYTEIRAGLQAGQEVVLSGQFLLDSEASLRGLEVEKSSRQTPAAEPMDHSAHSHGSQMDSNSEPVHDHSAAPAHDHSATHAADTPTYFTTAEVKGREGDTLTLRHGEIAELKWPAMTMGFDLTDDLAEDEIPLGAEIEIEFRLPPEGAPQIIRWQRAGETP